ncbi:MAG: fumarylacetoacetate hydrolase family protein [Hyphomicrobiaceae bacterium]|nr:fumarylacetoacetate hydrolase family protein [Hyphomicrobiaceae bacterium]
MTPQQEQLAERLAIARREGRQIEALDDALVPTDAASGYEVNRRMVELLGWPTLGWKIAGTTDDVRKRLRIDTPIYGRTFRRFGITSPCRLRRAELLDPLIECEFFITLGADLAHRAEPWTYDEVRDAVRTVHAGVEMAECRFPMGNLPPLPAILADGAANGRYIYGDEITAWREGLADIEVRVFVNGQERRQGSGREVMGDPLAPLHWLAEALRQRGMGLAAGEMVSTGSCTGMMPLREARGIDVRFGDSAMVSIGID